MSTKQEIDYKTAEKLIKQKFSKLYLEGNICKALAVKEKDGWRHVEVSVSISSNDAAEIFVFRYGLGHVAGLKNPEKESLGYCQRALVINGLKEKPSPALIFARYCKEGLDAKNQSFEDWCGDCGYDTDSIKALKIYEECKGSLAKVLKFVSEEDAEEFAELDSSL